MQASGEFRSQELQRNLEIADKLRELCTSIKGDQEFKEKFSENVPQIVVLGMQSMGKSSVLELLSGVKFPRSGTMCTRLRIVLKLKRGPQLKTTVALKGPSEFMEAFNSGNITDDIKMAQDRSVKVSGQPIARDYLVEIICQDPSRINVTLVDLPGYFAPKTDADVSVSELVKELGEDCAQMKNSLVLHVMGINQDYGNVSTKLTISKLDKDKVINVFTMPELLQALGTEKAKERLDDYLKQTEHPRFIVYGECAEGEQKEIDFIRNLPVFSSVDEDTLRVGIPALGLYLETRFSEHTAATLPDLRKVLRKDLEVIERWLEENKEKSPQEIVQVIGTKVQLSWPEEEHQKEIRKILETMRAGIRRVRIQPFHSKTKSAFRHAELTELEIGDEVHVKVEVPSSIFSSGTKKDEQSDQYEAKIIKYCDGHRIEFTDGTETTIERTFVPDLEVSLVEEVLAIMEKRGLTNASFFDPHIVLREYMENFADRYGEILNSTAVKTNEVATKTVRDMFDIIEVPISAKQMKQVLLEDVIQQYETLLTQAQQTMQRMVRWCKYPLTYTTNEHYLLQNIRVAEKKADMEDAVRVLRSSRETGRNVVDTGILNLVIQSLENKTRPVTDGEVLRDAAVRIIRCVEGFWKVKVKAITEAAASELALIFCVEVKEILSKVGNSTQKYAHLVKDPTSFIIERKKYSERARVLREGLELFS